MPKPVTLQEISAAIQAAGLANSALAMHSSLKSFGRLEGGPDTLLRAFAQAGCTLLVPTFTYDCIAPRQRDIPQNGDEGYTPSETDTAVFDPHNTHISPDMGSIPARILQTAGRVRGRHPVDSFTALGPLAEALIARQEPLNIFGPYQWLYDHLPAFVLLLGVDLTKATPIHFAEQCAGRRLFRRWGREAGGVVENEQGGCSEGFNRLDPFLQPIERKIFVGPSLWRIYPFREFVDITAGAIRADPAITHCDDPNCIRCRDAVLGGPLL